MHCTALAGCCQIVNLCATWGMDPKAQALPGDAPDVGCFTCLCPAAPPHTCNRLVRKTLLVPPPMPADKRRALNNRGGELPPRPDLAPRPRSSARFTLVRLGLGSGARRRLCRN